MKTVRSQETELKFVLCNDRLCGLLVKFLAADTEVSGSIPGTTRFSE